MSKKILTFTSKRSRAGHTRKLQPVSSATTQRRLLTLDEAQTMFFQNLCRFDIKITAETYERMSRVIDEQIESQEGGKP